MSLFPIISKLKFTIRLTAGFLVVICLGCSNQELVNENDVEYRKDKDGNRILYKIGRSQPFGQSKIGRVSGKYKNGQKRFDVGFVNGLKHGTFFFWQPNGIKNLSGSFEKGKREGIFTAYGKAGELVYEKNFRNDELDGNFTLYYPLSHSEVFRYSELTKKNKVEFGDIPIRSIPRLKATFSKGIPTGRYQVFYHPRGQKNMSLLSLLKEEGQFNEQGKLVGQQISYYPRTESLVVYMPDDQPLETFHDSTTSGLSRAIDQCYEEIKKLPAYRNPKNLPAKVFAVDARGNRIAPIWSSNVESIAIRNLDGFLLPARYSPTFESYRDEAVKMAEEILLSLEISEKEKVLAYQQIGSSIELVGLNSEGQIIDILWSSRKRDDVIPLEDRIIRKRPMIRRGWKSGESAEAEWLISDGLRLVIQNKEEPILFMPR